MKAVVLAAGLSSRLSGGVPKSLLFLRDQTTMIGHTISQLDSLGFSTTVVIGYRAPFFLTTLATSVSFAYNPIYASTASIYSLKVAIDLLREKDPIMVVWGDQLASTEAIEELIQVPDSILVTPLTPEYGAEYALGIDEGKVVQVIPFKKFPKRGREYYGYGGVGFLSKKVLDRIDQLSPHVLAHSDLPVIFEGCNTVIGDCENINNPATLIRVQRKFKEGQWMTYGG